MYKKRLEDDGVDPAIISMPQQVQCAAEELHEKRPTDAAIATFSPHPHQPTSSSTAATFPITTAAAAAAVAAGTKENSCGISRGAPTSAFVPKGAYRRIVCMPSDLSWTEAELSSSDDSGTTILPANDGFSGVCSSSVASSAAEAVVHNLGEGSVTNDNITGTVSRSPSTITLRGEMETGRGVNLAARGAKEVVGDGNHLLTKQEKKQKKEQGAVIRGVQMSFTLPPGSYATMCLREVMRQDFDISATALGAGDELKDGL